MIKKNSGIGISLVFVCLVFLGVMPIISNARPSVFDALSFAFFLSIWQLVFSLPLLIKELASENKGIFSAALSPSLKRRTITIILLTGSFFGASTYLYVLSVEKAGAVSAAIAMQAYPLFAILWETIFLKKRKAPSELLLTLVILVALYFLATNGTWRIEGFSYWFLVALGIPFLWSIAHVIIKEVLDKTPITPAQVTFFRVFVSSLFLGIILASVHGLGGFLQGMGDFVFQKFALIMGLVYYLEIIIWFYAVRHIDVSLGSTIIVPWPALTMILSIFLLGEAVENYQLIAFAIVATSIYGLLFIDARKNRPHTVGDI